MIDWHSHVLPAMDDGSRNLEESLGMLKLLREQGVRRVIATPHFYANDEDVNRFLERRTEAFCRLEPALTDEHPQVLCGAEVRYYPGIGRMADLDKLVIGSTKLLLLEMPFSKWTDYTMKELTELASYGRLTIILAHIDRYLKFQNSATWNKLLECGFLMQVNASFVYEFATKGKARKMLSEGKIHFIGSDCHNLTSRPPRIGEAYSQIQKKFGDDFVANMTGYGHYKLKHN